MAGERVEGGRRKMSCGARLSMEELFDLESAHQREWDQISVGKIAKPQPC